MSEIKNKILDIAESMALAIGPQNIVQASLCEAAGISPGSLTHIMGMTFTELVASLPAGEVTEITRARTQPFFRKRSILLKAVELAWTGSYCKLTRDSVAKAAGVSAGSVAKYFGTMGALKAAVMHFAIKQNIVEIVTQGLAVDDRHALQCSKELKEKAARYIARK